MAIDNHPGTIMLIDDQPENLTVLSEMLMRHGYAVRAFIGGEMALASARDEVPDGVLLDIRMPDMDGFSVCGEFKADDRLRHTPVIFLTGVDQTSEKIRAFELGGADYITKPFAGQEVLARIQLQIEVSRYRRGLEDMVRLRTADLAEANRRLRVWDEAKQQWLDTVAHELRTPLQGVLGIAELLFTNLPASEASQPLLDAYGRSRSRLLKLIDDALTLTHIDVGSEDFAVSPVPIGDVLAEAIESAAASAASPGMLRMPSTVPTAAVVRADPALLRRALTDLALTACRSVEDEESVVVELALEGPMVRVSLATSGRSLPEEALESFFDVWGQRSLLRGGGDYGLSPALASRIVQLFGGRTEVRNRPARGIAIDVRLPIVRTSVPSTERP